MSTEQPGRSRATGSWEKLKPDFPAVDPIENPDPETIIQHLGETEPNEYGTVAPPIYQTSNFSYPDIDDFARRQTAGENRYDYSRVGNPTVQLLEAKIARLEQAEWCDAFGSGMGAISAALNACLQAGDHIVSVAHCYGPASWYMNHLRRFNIKTQFVNSTETADFIKACQANTRVLYLESPTSGRFEMLDVPALTAFARENGIVTIFDNSYATPLFCRPLELGIDIVVHSATKYLNGHSDVVAGIVLGRDQAIRERLWTEVELSGAALDPFAGWLLLRGLRTLGVRMNHHQRVGLEVAQFLEQHPAVRTVRHPGLPSHPQHERAAAQLSGWSGLFSFELVDQQRSAIETMFRRLRLFRHAVSWGGYESLIIGGTMFSDRPDRPENLIRVSIGLESPGDLIADLKQSLE